jgi:hypothetical protein
MSIFVMELNEFNVLFLPKEELASIGILLRESDPLSNSNQYFASEERRNPDQAVESIRRNNLTSSSLFFSIIPLPRIQQ